MCRDWEGSGVEWEMGEWEGRLRRSKMKKDKE